MEWFAQEALLPPYPGSARLHGLCRPYQLPLIHGTSAPSSSPQHVAAVPRFHHAAILHLHGAQGLSILVSQLFCGGFLGFWHALVLHVITLPVDILVLLGLSIWGTVVLNQDGTDACRLDEICLPFARLVHLNVVLGYAYILINLFLKPLLLGLFCFCLGGIRLMHKDEAEEKDWQLRSLQGKVISGLHSGTFSSIYGAISPRPKRRQRRDAASRRRPPT